MLTAEELEQEEIYLQKRRESMKKWRDKKQAQEEKRKLLSQKEVLKVGKSKQEGSNLLSAC